MSDMQEQTAEDREQEARYRALEPHYREFVDANPADARDIYISVATDAQIVAKYLGSADRVHQWYANRFASPVEVPGFDPNQHSGNTLSFVYQLAVTALGGSPRASL